MRAPTGLSIKQGKRVSTSVAAGLLDLQVDENSSLVELSIPQHPDLEMMIPVRVSGRLRRRWTVGLWQHSGWALGKEHSV